MFISDTIIQTKIYQADSVKPSEGSFSLRHFQVGGKEGEHKEVVF